jgi:hypothetical protein
MKQKGGSVASDAVTSLVTPDTYHKMNMEFTNSYLNSQCGGQQNLEKCKACGGSGKIRSKNKSYSGGNSSFGDFVQNLANGARSAMSLKSNYVNPVFKDTPAEVWETSVLPRNTTVMANAKSEFAMEGGKKKKAQTKVTKKNPMKKPKKKPSANNW